MTNYTVNTWNTGDIVTKAKMDHAEAGIASHTHAAVDIVAGAAVPLADAATVATNAALGSYFRLTTANSRTLGSPTNATDGMVVTWEIIATAGITIALTTGSSGAFLFGTTITALSATTSGKRDLITARYSSSAARWLVVDYQKGF